jgi:diketogulonate reductase-like aldo/keto reductase
MSVSNTFFELRNGVEMPALGFGVFKIGDGAPVEAAVADALKEGYRSFDTAAIYGNEIGVGTAIKNADISRSDIFLTSKLWNADQGYKQALNAFEETLSRMGTDYLDLYLIHWPVEDLFQDSWAALEDIYNAGKVRAIGVSNFALRHLKLLFANCRIIPMVNQIEFHPWLQQPELIRYCKSKGILPEAWSPLMKGEVSKIPVLTEIGKKYGKSAFQVVLRWDFQQGIATIPKSVQPDRIKSNADIFDFELTDEEIRKINQMDRNHRIGPDPENFDF